MKQGRADARLVPEKNNETRRAELRNQLLRGKEQPKSIAAVLISKVGPDPIGNPSFIRLLGPGAAPKHVIFSVRWSPGVVLWTALIIAVIPVCNPLPHITTHIIDA